MELTIRTKIKPDTHTAYDVATKARDKPIESTTLPLRFTGVENQYFATLMALVPPTGDDTRLDRETIAIPLHEDPKALQKADVGVAE